MKTFNSVEIKTGLGDCLIGAACAQEFYKLNGKKIKFVTSKLLEPILKDNPNFEFDSSGEGELKLLWPSQMNRFDLYRLHTSERFSMQMGFHIDPSKTVDIYLDNVKQICDSSEKTVCINAYSAERSRRFIPKQYINLILDFCSKNNYKVRWLGMNDDPSSILDIKTCVEILRTTSLFVGPISFQYHLAAAMNCPSILFSSYMPHYKYSHFKNTHHIYSNRSCVDLCEEKENEMRSLNNCFDMCKAIDYSEKDIIQALNTKLL
jgi:hypothetical protein